MIPIIIASVAGLIYANFGFKVGVDVGKDVFRKSKGHSMQTENAVIVGLLAGVIWPLLLVTLLTKQKKNKILEEIPQALLADPDTNPESSVDVGQKLVALEEKKAQLDQQVSELGQQIEELKADPEVSKVLEFPKRF